MAYRAKKFTLKNGSFSFKILYERIESGVRSARGVPKEQWAVLGLFPSMTFDEAKLRVQELNAVEALKRREASRRKVIERVEAEEAAQFEFLPAMLVKQFETDKLFARSTGSKDKVASYWKAIKRMLCTLKILPEDWEDQAHKFYTYFVEQHFSPAYVQKLTHHMNKWGMYYAKKTRTPFVPLPFPTGKDRAAIVDANEDKPDRRGNKKSAALTPALLEKRKNSLSAANFNWIYISLWAGLRPYEVDGLKDKQRYKLEKVDGIPVLWVYQSKLKSVPRKERWKYIPLFTKEQERIPELIALGAFKQPLHKTVLAHFGEEFSPYMGRKGFYSLMKSLGQDPDHIQVWLGHKTYDTTYEHYVDKTKVTWTKRVA